MLTDILDRATDRAVIPHASRRGFLIGATAFAGGLMVGFRPMAASAQTTVLNPFDGYVAVAPDGTVTILSAHMEMGQGIYHGIATLVNEELMADWAKIRVEGGSANPAYYGNMAWGGRIQGTGGSPACRRRSIATAPRALRRD